VSMPDWVWGILFLLAVGVGILCLFSILVALLIGLPWYTFVVPILIGVIILIGLIWCLINPFAAFEGFGWIGVGVWLGIWSTLAVLVFLGWREEKLEKRKKALALELEDQLKELKEQLDLGYITQEEYEQKKKLLEKSEG